MEICGIIAQRDFNGSEYTDYVTVSAQLSAIFSIHRPVKLVSGGGRGIETLVERYATEHSFPFEKVPPNISGQGKEAFEQRNAEIVSLSDYMLIFWDGRHQRYDGVLRIATIQKKLTTLVPILGN